MIIAYGGGITLSLYPIADPIDKLKDALTDNSKYIVNDSNDYIKINFSKQFINDLITKWKQRTNTSEIELFKKFLENIYFQCRLFEDGYLEVFIKTESDEIEYIFVNEIIINSVIKKGFSDEIEWHFRDLYVVVFNKVHIVSVL